MELIAGPMVERRPAQHYLGIRTVTPFRGMLAERDRMLAELFAWLDGHGVENTSAFFQLHVIDMDGPMDIEVGAIVPRAAKGDDLVKPGTLPAGDYATLTYRDHSLRANRALLDWARDKAIPLDQERVPAGDRFACRYELYLTDPRTEPRKTRWTVQLNILTRPNGTAQGASHG